ncbi:restriction endonuclease subunit S [Clostridium botulinum]|nr:restriction endonuclease subunit S [Clostridium botulinum]
MNKVPKLRFPEFSGEWEEKKCSNLFDKIRNSVDVEENKLYKQIGIRSHGKGIFYKDEVIGKELGNKRVFWVEPNVFIVNIVFAWERAIARTTENERGMIASHRFPMYKPKEEILDLDYITCFFKTNKGKALLELASPGGAGRNKTLGQKEFDNLKIILPKVEEQKKIGSILSLMDKKIQKQQEKVEALKDYKKCMMQKIFSQEIRFKGENGEEYPEWEEKKLVEIGRFYRGHSYNATDVVKNGLLVLRSNNIKDNNITLDSDLQFVSKICKEDIKLKENDIVICMANGSRNLVGKSGEYKSTVKYQQVTVGAFCSIYRTDNKIAKYLFQLNYYYKYLDILLSGTNINNLKNSQLELLSFMIPSISEEQEKIANFLSTLDQKLEKEQEKLDSLNEWKKGLLQQMFV